MAYGDAAAGYFRGATAGLPIGAAAWRYNRAMRAQKAVMIDTFVKLHACTSRVASSPN
jgi:hypothetical protein